MPTKKTWYVQAVGHTNEAVAAEFAALLSTENFHRDVLCIDGVKRPFWECDYAFVSNLLKSEANAHLEFEVFYREGPHGPVRRWPFLRRKKLSLKTALKKGIVKKGLSSARV